MKNKKIISYKKFMISWLLICSALLISFAATIVIVDPFYHYHSPIGRLKVMAIKQAYQNLGMAKHLSYDSFITGSSMTENFKTSQFEKLFGGHAIKLSFSGGRARNYELLFKEAFSSKNEIKNVLYGLDAHAFGDELYFQTNIIPEYLYDSNYFSDTEYILNKTVMFKYLIPYLKSAFTNENINWDETYSWYKECTFGEAAVKANYFRPEKEEEKDGHLLDENFTNNLNTLLPYINNHPETEFYIFFPPYSILCYDSWSQRGLLKAYLSGYEILTKELVRHKNVHLNAFYADQSIICNLDNYKDYTHYSEKISEYILQAIHDETHRITKENADAFLESTRHFFLSYDYDSLFK